MTPRKTQTEVEFACPSSQPEVEDAQILGLIEDKNGKPSVTYVSGHQPVTEELMHLSAPLRPTDVFRFAARCNTSSCTHFDGKDCQLATRILAGFGAVDTALPACALRKSCRWYAQEGGEICLRCSQITTNFDPRDDHAREIAGLPNLETK